MTLDSTRNMIEEEVPAPPVNPFTILRRLSIGGAGPNLKKLFKSLGSQDLFFDQIIMQADVELAVSKEGLSALSGLDLGLDKAALPILPFAGFQRNVSLAWHFDKVKVRCACMSTPNPKMIHVKSVFEKDPCSLHSLLASVASLAQTGLH